MDNEAAPGSPVTTSVSELRRIVETLLDHLAERGDVIELSHDYYWSLTAEARRHVPDEPAGATIGTHSEGLENLRAMIAADEPLAYGLVWVSELLRTIGDDAIV